MLIKQYCTALYRQTRAWRFRDKALLKPAWNLSWPLPSEAPSTRPSSEVEWTAVNQIDRQPSSLSGNACCLTPFWQRMCRVSAKIKEDWMEHGVYFISANANHSKVYSINGVSFTGIFLPSLYTQKNILVL